MSKEAMKLALEGAANYIDALGGDSRKYRQALADQPAQQEPVAWRVKVETKLRDGSVDLGYQLRNERLSKYDEPLYTSPPARRKPLTIQPIIKDDCGVLRFKKNGLVDALYEHGVKTGFGLNELHCMEFSNEDRQQFAQLIGYSVSGYGDLSYVTDEAYEAAAEAAHGIKENT